MRSQLGPLLQRSAAQAGGLGQLAIVGVAAEVQGALTSITVAVTCRQFSAEAAVLRAAAEQGSEAAEVTSSADASAPPAAAGAEAVSAATASEQAGSSSSRPAHDSSRPTHAASNAKRNGNGQRRTAASPTADKEMLINMGLVPDGRVEHNMFANQKRRLARLQQIVPLLRELPSAGMLAACINPHQLQCVVSPAMDYGGQLHPLEYNSDWVNDAIKDAQRRREQSSSSSTSSSSSGRSSSSSASSSGSGHGTQQPSQQRSERAAQQQRKQQQQQQQPLERQRVSAQRTAYSTLSEKDWALYKVALQPGNLVQSNNSELMVNLNVQMNNALADSKPLAAIVLFDQLLDKGIHAAQEQQRLAGQQQQQQPLLLPQQFRPDYTAFGVYCRAAARQADIYTRGIHRAVGMQRTDKFNGRGNYNSVPPAEELSRLREASRELLARVERAATMWTNHEKDGGMLAAVLHLAVMASANAAGKHKKVIEYWDEVQSRVRPEVLSSFWRLHAWAVSSALHARDLERADRYALVFSDKVNAVSFHKEDYIRRIGPLMVQLVAHMSKAHMWDQAVYWLQQLLNHDPLLPVEDGSFLILQKEAAAGGRMDLARVMLTALDDTRKLQNRPPYVYSELQCIGLMMSAAKASDVAFIETIWHRLCEDITRDRSNNVRARRLFDSSSKLVNDISGDASTDPALQDAVSDSSSKSSSKSQQQHPGASVYAQLIKALVQCEAYGKAFEYLHAMEQVYGGQAACSVYQGVRAFPEALNTEPKIAAAFAQLKARKDEGKPITATLLNVLMRAIARNSDTTTAGKVFNAYEATWGLQPNVDTYNAVLESCEAHGKLAAVQGMMGLMTQREVTPDTVSWNLLLSTAIRAEDSKAVVSALNRMRSANINPAEDQLQRAADLAFNKGDAGLQTVLRQFAAESLPPSHILNRRLNGPRFSRPGTQGGTWGPKATGRDVWNSSLDSSSSSGGGSSSTRGGGSSSSGAAGGDRSSSSSRSSSSGVGRSSGSGSSTADVWRPGKGDQSDHKQGAGGQEAGSDSDGNGGNSRRLAGLKAAIGG